MTHSVNDEIRQVVVSFNLTLHISDELLGEILEERLHRKFRLFKVELGLLAEEECMELHPVVEMQPLEAFHAEQARVVLSNRHVLALEGLFFLIEVAAHIRRKLLQHRVKEPREAGGVLLARELTDALLKRQIESPSHAVGRGLDLDDAGARIRLCQE